MNIQALQISSHKTPTSPIDAQHPEHESFWGKDGFTFNDIVDMFNPLHHMPVISKYYREQTHDDASEGSRLVGGALFGGLMGGVAGLLTSFANSAVRHETHQDVSEQLLAIAEDSLKDFSSFPENKFQNKGFGAQSQSVSIEREMNNPFFAQTLGEDINGYFYSAELEHASIQRKRDWGKV